MLDEKWFPDSLAKGTLITEEELFDLEATEQVDKKEFLQAIDLWLQFLDKDLEKNSSLLIHEITKK